eukprot:GEMP01022669.1.p1 GENE.GEMP01022669.1~~GEMP01022669.1.p1  ORF type:complete len:635 (+),score=89.96 GEMP01022669.1:106-1905(+)
MWSRVALRRFAERCASTSSSRPFIGQHPLGPDVLAPSSTHNPSLKDQSERYKHPSSASSSAPSSCDVQLDVPSDPYESAGKIVSAVATKYMNFPDQESDDVAAMQRFVERIIRLDRCYPKSTIVNKFILFHDSFLSMDARFTARWLVTKYLMRHVNRFKVALIKSAHYPELLPLVEDLALCWSHPELTTQLFQMNLPLEDYSLDDMVVPQTVAHDAEHIENVARSAPVHTSMSRIKVADVMVTIRCESSSSSQTSGTAVSRTARQPLSSERMVFVFNLHYGVTADQLRERFELHGEVEDVTLIDDGYERMMSVRHDRDSVDNIKKNEMDKKPSAYIYAFITFADVASAKKITSPQCRLFGLVLPERTTTGILAAGGSIVYPEKAVFKRTLMVQRMPWNSSFAEVLKAMMEKLSESPECPASMKFEVINSSIFKDEQVQWDGERKTEVIEYLNVEYSSSTGVQVHQKPPFNTNYEGLDFAELNEDEDDNEQDDEGYVPSVAELTKENVRKQQQYSHWRRNDGMMFLRFPTFEDAFWANRHLSGFMWGNRKVAVDFSTRRGKFLRTESGSRFIDRVTPEFSSKFNDGCDPVKLYGVDLNLL